MHDKSAEYAANGGWSSKLFALNAIQLMQELVTAGVPVTAGRSVIHIGKKLKAYVHHNGRTKEYATITDMHGIELETFHFTEFDKLREFVLASCQ